MKELQNYSKDFKPEVNKKIIFSNFECLSILKNDSDAAM